MRRYEKSKNNNLVCVSLRLPYFDGFDRMHEHDDIKCEIITNPEKTANFKDNNYSNAYPNFRYTSHEKTQSHHAHIRNRVQNTISDISESNSCLAISIYDDGGIFEKFPSPLDTESKKKPIFQRKPTSDEPEKSIKQNTVNDV